jgi:hypothetical protein
MTIIRCLSFFAFLSTAAAQSGDATFIRLIDFKLVGVWANIEQNGARPFDHSQSSSYLDVNAKNLISSESWGFDIGAEVGPVDKSSDVLRDKKTPLLKAKMTRLFAQSEPGHPLCSLQLSLSHHFGHVSLSEWEKGGTNGRLGLHFRLSDSRWNAFGEYFATMRGKRKIVDPFVSKVSQGMPGVGMLLGVGYSYLQWSASLSGEIEKTFEDSPSSEIGDVLRKDLVLELAIDWDDQWRFKVGALSRSFDHELFLSGATEDFERTRVEGVVGFDFKF